MKMTMNRVEIILTNELAKLKAPTVINLLNQETEAPLPPKNIDIHGRVTKIKKIKVANKS